MRIAQISYTGFGGLGSVVFSLVGADTLREQEWLVGFIGDQPLDHSYPERCRKHQMPFATFQSTAGRPYRAWLSLMRWLFATRPDAVICHSINSILACRIYGWWTSATVIAVEHEPNQVKSRSVRAASRVAMLVADAVVVLTDEYRWELRKAYQWTFRPDKVSVIPNGIDVSVFTPSPMRFSTPGIRLGMAARFSPTKRQDLLVRVMERLAEIRPNLIVTLSFAGDGSELARVKALVDSVQVSQVSFEGLLPEDAIGPWMRSLDIYVHATDGETLSTSLLQAMSTGLPIVASAIPGVENLLGTDHEYGICVTNDAESFALAVLGVLDDPQRAMRMGARARQKVMETYSHHSMLQKYLAVLEECR